MKLTKRTLAVLLALVLLCVGVPFAAAEDVTVVASGTANYGLTWQLDSAGTLTISGNGDTRTHNYGTTSDNGTTRTAAPWGPYYRTIKAVIIGDGVMGIGNNAFYRCTALKSVTFGDGLRSIGYDAFYYCTALESVTFGDSLQSIGSSAFDNCTALESVTFGDGLQSVGSYAFYYCIALESVTFGNGLQNIGNYAFCNCTALESVTFGDGLQSIGYDAFANCTALESVTFGDGLQSIGDSAFFYCTALKSVTFPDGLKSIGGSAFSNCTALESVTFGDGLQSIGGNAFDNCTALESVTLPDGVTSLGGNAFGNSNWFTLVRCNRDTDTAATIATSGYPYAFIDGTDEDNLISETVNAKLSYTIDKRTRTLTVTNDGTMVSFASFTAPWVEYQKYITDVVIEPGCTSVSSSAFQNCYNIKRVTLPDGIEKIDGSAFSNCSHLTAINLPEGVETIGNYAFCNCSSLPSLVLPDSVTSIGSYAFRYCYALESVTFGDGLQSIGSYAFQDCTALESVTFGDSLQSIGYEAFRNCTALKSVMFGDGVTSIGYEAFRNCTALESLVIPDSVTYLGYNNNDGGVFRSCTSLKTVVIGDGVTSISPYAFSGCSALETVSIGESVKYIYEMAFSGCSSLTSVTFGESVKNIYRNAFSGCSSLATVVLPASVTSLSSRAFPEKALKDIYIYSDNCSIAEDAIYYSATIHAYQGSTAETFANTYGYSFVPITDAPPHEHDKTLVPGYAATCTAAGLTDGYKCSVCGVWFQKQKEIKALGHNYQAVETVPATETEPGYVRYECSRCDAGYTETLPVLTHEHSYSETERVNATCLEDGYVTYTCAGCGHSYTDLLPASGHSFGAWKTFLPTEAGQQGIDVRFCDVCGVYELRESESVSGGSTTPAEHTHSFVELERKEPDCENAGYVRAMCACGAGTVEVLAALGHDYAVGDCVLETCTTAGYTPFVCTRCGNEIQTDLVPALGHLWNDGEVTAAPTCSADGITTYTCTREGCGETLEKTIPKDPDAHSFKVTTVAPTCLDNGYTSHACRYCRYGYTDNIVPALGHIDEDGNKVCDRCEQPLNHVFTNYVSDNNATCKEDGTKTAVCDICGIATDTIPDVGSHLTAPHQYEWTDMNDATCVANAHRKGVCKICGADVIEEIPDTALGHTEENMWYYSDNYDCEMGGSRYKTCTRCGDITVTVAVPPTAHNEVIDPEIPKTCTTNGKSAGTHCERCGKVLVAQVVYPAVGHELQAVEAVEVTCTTPGSTAGTKCSVCGEILSGCETIEQLGHVFNSERVKVNEPTCEEEGLTGHPCLRCGYVLDPESIPPLGHIDENDDGQCDRCAKILRAPDPQPQEEEPQGFFAKIGAFFRNLFDRIFGIFRR